MRWLSFLTVVCWSVVHWTARAELAFEAGLRQQFGAADPEITGTTVSRDTGFQLGVSGGFPMNERFSLRTGLFYAEKPVKVENLGASTTAKHSYVQVPATLAIRLQDYANLYLGLNLELKLEAKCGSSDCANAPSWMTPVVVGTSFRFAPQLGANLFFEASTDKPSRGVGDFRALGVNLMIHFD